MNNNLQPARLGELLTSLKTGLNPRKNFKLNTKDANNWYVTVRELNGIGIDFLPQTDKVNDGGLKLINNRSNLEIGDVLFSGTGTIGKTAIVDKIPSNWNIKEGVYSLKPNKDRLDSYYLMYLLKYLATLNIFSKISAGSTVFSVPMNILEDLKIKIHDLNGQINVSKVLKTIDFKIELNKRINAELESVAKNLYDYWFVQFDFPDENGKPYKSSGGKMVRNEELKREIPEGWEVCRLDTVETNIVTGKTPSTKDSTNFNGYVPFICIGDLRQGMYVIKTEATLSEKGASLQKNKYIPEGSICVSCIATPGLVAISSSSAQTNQQLNSVAIEKSYNRHFLYFYLTDYFKYAKAKTGNTFTNMNKEDFSSIQVIYPPVAVLKKFLELVEPVGQKILSGQQENNELAKLRDWLLPMLMNGQVKVRDV